MDSEGCTLRYCLNSRQFYLGFDGLVQERRNSSALAVELCLSCTNPSICSAEICNQCQCSTLKRLATFKDAFKLIFLSDLWISINLSWNFVEKVIRMAYGWLGEKVEPWMVFLCNKKCCEATICMAVSVCFGCVDRGNSEKNHLNNRRKCGST